MVVEILREFSMRFTVSEMQAAERLTMNSNPSLETNVTYSGSSFDIFGVRCELIVKWVKELTASGALKIGNARTRADVLSAQIPKFFR